jgi:hypothetical protein
MIGHLLTQSFKEVMIYVFLRRERRKILAGYGVVNRWLTKNRFNQKLSDLMRTGFPLVSKHIGATNDTFPIRFNLKNAPQ